MPESNRYCFILFVITSEITALESRCDAEYPSFLTENWIWNENDDDVPSFARTGIPLESSNGSVAAFPCAIKLPMPSGRCGVPDTAIGSSVPGLGVLSLFCTRSDTHFSATISANDGEAFSHDEAGCVSLFSGTAIAPAAFSCYTLLHYVIIFT